MRWKAFDAGVRCLKSDDFDSMMARSAQMSSPLSMSLWSDERCSAMSPKSASTMSLRIRSESNCVRRCAHSECVSRYGTYLLVVDKAFKLQIEAMRWVSNLQPRFDQFYGAQRSHSKLTQKNSLSTFQFVTNLQRHAMRTIQRRSYGIGADEHCFVMDVIESQKMPCQAYQKTSINTQHAFR